jgi:hypothetical protein
MVVKTAESNAVPLGGETELVGLINVDNVTDEIAPSKMSVVRPLVILTVPSGEVRPVSVNPRMRLPGAVEFTSIVSVSNDPEASGGVPDASAETVNESVAPQQRVGERETGLPAEINVVKVGGKVGLSPPLMVMVFALALEDQSSAPAASAAAAVSREFLIFELLRTVPRIDLPMGPTEV